MTKKQMLTYHRRRALNEPNRRVATHPLAGAVRSELAVDSARPAAIAVHDLPPAGRGEVRSVPRERKGDRYKAVALGLARPRQRGKISGSDLGQVRRSPRPSGHTRMLRDNDELAVRRRLRGVTTTTPPQAGTRAAAIAAHRDVLPVVRELPLAGGRRA